MRLIDSHSLELKEFYGSKIPSNYAILSHRWGEDEVTFQDWQRPAARSTKEGYSKIVDACRIARKQDMEYVWVDTCCIDKSSSAELSEAINSMFAWYRDAQVCYAYLDDVPSEHECIGSKKTQLQRFRESLWFTRGWTLQELLAPSRVIFFAENWSKIGTKISLAGDIMGVTNIEEPFLTHAKPLAAANIAKKMSWLSRRVTTRAEDMAYCMLGIFDINMPLLYGEGAKAFIRLQEELVRVSNDQTLFCWAWELDKVPAGWSSIFAPSPSVFASSADYIECPSTDGEVCSYSMTNAGLLMKQPMTRSWKYSFAVLNARKATESPRRLCAIPVADLYRQGVFERQSFPPEPTPLQRTWVGDPQSAYIRYRTSITAFAAPLPAPTPQDPEVKATFTLTMDRNDFIGEVTETTPRGCFSAEQSLVSLRTCLAESQSQEANVYGALLHVRKNDGKYAAIYLGAKTFSRPGTSALLFCRIVSQHFYESLGPDFLLADLSRLVMKRTTPILSHRLGPSISVAVDRRTRMSGSCLIAVARIAFNNNGYEGEVANWETDSGGETER